MEHGGRTLLLLGSLAAVSACGTLLGTDDDEPRVDPDASVDGAASASEGGVAFEASSSVEAAATDGAQTDAADGALPPDKVVFLSSQTWGPPGIFQGALNRAGGDRLCQTEANGVAALQGKTFLAWLSDSTVGSSAIDRLQPGRWRLPTGGVVFASKTAITTTSPALAIEEAASGIAIEKTPDQYVWTGTLGTGLASGNDCDGWQAQSNSSGTRGLAFAVNGSWTNAAGVGTCDQAYFLICIEP